MTETEHYPTEERKEAVQNHVKAAERSQNDQPYIDGPETLLSLIQSEKTGFPSMSRHQARLLLTELGENELETWGVANAEYADSKNIFANFNRISDHLGIPPEQVLMVYAHKHMDGITSWVKGNKAHREPITGRINDLRIYLSILYLMNYSREAGLETDSPQGMD